MNYPVYRPVLNERGTSAGSFGAVKSFAAQSTPEELYDFDLKWGQTVVNPTEIVCDIIYRTYIADLGYAGNVEDAYYDLLVQKIRDKVSGRRIYNGEDVEMLFNVGNLVYAVRKSLATQIERYKIRVSSLSSNLITKYGTSSIDDLQSYYDELEPFAKLYPVNPTFKRIIDKYFGVHMGVANAYLIINPAWVVFCLNNKAGNIKYARFNDATTWPQVKALITEAIGNLDPQAMQLAADMRRLVPSWFGGKPVATPTATITSTKAFLANLAETNPVSADEYAATDGLIHTANGLDPAHRQGNVGKNSDTGSLSATMIYTSKDDGFDLDELSSPVVGSANTGGAGQSSAVFLKAGSFVSFLNPWGKQNTTQAFESNPSVMDNVLEEQPTASVLFTSMGGLYAQALLLACGIQTVITVGKQMIISEPDDLVIGSYAQVCPVGLRASELTDPMLTRDLGPIIARHWSDHEIPNPKREGRRDAKKDEK